MILCSQEPFLSFQWSKWPSCYWKLNNTSILTLLLTPPLTSARTLFPISHPHSSCMFNSQLLPAIPHGKISSIKQKSNQTETSLHPWLAAGSYLISQLINSQRVSYSHFSLYFPLTAISSPPASPCSRNCCLGHSWLSFLSKPKTFCSSSYLNALQHWIEQAGSFPPEIFLPWSLQDSLPCLHSRLFQLILPSWVLGAQGGVFPLSTPPSSSEH